MATKRTPAISVSTVKEEPEVKLKKKGNALSLEAIVDRGYELNIIAKDVNAELEKIKAKLKAEGKKMQVKFIPGNEHIANFSDHTITSIDPHDLYKLMKKDGQEELFWQCIAVCVEKSRKVINEYDLDRITKKETNPWGRINFSE